MTEENKSPNTDETTSTGNTNQSTDTNQYDANEQRSHRNRRGSRRGGQGNQNAKNSKTANEITTDNTNSSNDKTLKNNQASSKTPDLPAKIEHSDIEQADESALLEGGIKTIGNQKIINFMKIAKPMMSVSAILIIVSIVAIIFNGLNLGLDFTGGVSADVVYEKSIETEQVTQTLTNNGFDDAVVQYLGTTQELLIRLPPQDSGKGVDGLNESLTQALNIEGNKVTINNINIIGSQVGNEVYLNSLMAIALALVCMLLYVAVRFQFKLSVGAVAALFHDAIITLGVFALFQWPFDLTVLAALLALIGYSLNDTIVVYDRIRENFRRVRGVIPSQVLDLSLTETLRRTFMTSSTVLLVVFAMLFLGGEGLFWFSIALFIGMVAGTYSSVYIASAIPLLMGLSRDDFVVTVKPEFAEEEVHFDDPKASEFEDEEVIKETKS